MTLANGILVFLLNLRITKTILDSHEGPGPFPLPPISIWSLDHVSMQILGNMGV